MTDGLQRQGVGQPAACEELGLSEPENWTVDANLLMRTVCFITFHKVEIILKLEEIDFDQIHCRINDMVSFLWDPGFALEQNSVFLNCRHFRSRQVCVSFSVSDFHMKTLRSTVDRPLGSDSTKLICWCFQSAGCLLTSLTMAVCLFVFI